MKINGQSLGWAIIWIILFISMAFMVSGLEDGWEALFYLLVMLALAYGIIREMGRTFKK